MNISDNNIQKLIEIKQRFYQKIKERINDEIVEDGTIFVKLDQVQKDYDYFYKSSDCIKITKRANNIDISDNFDECQVQQRNENYYNFAKCEKQIESCIIKEIEKYNKNNEKISKFNQCH